MLYPGTNEADARQARAFAARWLAEPLRLFHAAGFKLSYDALAEMFTDAGEQLSGLDERWWGGTATGELFKTFLALAMTKPALASWNNATKIAELVATRHKASGSRTTQWEARQRFLSVAHLWGAWSIREGQFATDPESGYSEFQTFLAEAENLRYWGQTWRAPREASKPPLPAEVWRVPDTWQPPTGWPQGVWLPDLALPDDLLAELKPAGRPRKTK